MYYEIYPKTYTDIFLFLIKIYTHIIQKNTLQPYKYKYFFKNFYVYKKKPMYLAINDTLLVDPMVSYHRNFIHIIKFILILKTSKKYGVKINMCMFFFKIKIIFIYFTIQSLVYSYYWSINHFF